MKFINTKIDYFKLTESISINVLSLSSESNDYSLSPQTSDWKIKDDVLGQSELLKNQRGWRWVIEK